MACSDYLAIKKQKIQNLYMFNSKSNSEKNSNSERISSVHTKNNQYCNLQNISILDEDGDLLSNKRFNIPIIDTKLYSKYNNTLASKFSNMYTMPRIHTATYIKYRYQPPFCWTCVSSAGEINYQIAALIPGMTDEIEQYEVDNNIISTSMSETDIFSNIDKLLDDYDFEQDNWNITQNT
jgi:hypothetical protein